MGRVAIVTMPFGSARRPSLQVGLLTGLARQAGWTADPMHLNVEFAELLGRHRYEALCQHRGTMLSDWLFSEAAFGPEAPDKDGRFLDGCEFGLTESALGLESGKARDWLNHVRRALVPAYLETMLASVPWSDYDV